MPCLENCIFFGKSCWLSQHNQNRPSGWFGAYFFGMKREGERGWMKPPLPFSNKGMLIILLVLLFRVGISSHPVQFLDPFGEVDLINVGAGGGYKLPPPHSGVTGFCGGCVWEWCGGTTLHTTLTHAHVYGKHVHQTCLYTRLIWETCWGACGHVLGGNTSHPSKDTILTFDGV